VSTAELLARCRAIGVKLSPRGDRLHIDAPRGAIDADLRADLTAHREEILAALAPPPPDPLADPVFMRLTDWLWEIIGTCNGECFIDEHGRRWDVLGTAVELYWWTPCSLAWLDEVEAFSKALTQHRSQNGG
jgi:hypothetical protein